MLPLYKTIYDLVNNKGLWAEGGLIGYNCSHVYPHTAKKRINITAPDNLKGVDMLMFEVFSSMGLGVQFRPVLCDPFDTKEDDTEEETPVSQAVIGETLKLMWYDNDRDEEMKEMYNWWAGKAAMTYAGRKGYIDAGRVLWLHGFDHKEPQLAWLAYGNEASISMECSSLAMIVKVSLGGVVGP